MRDSFVAIVGAGLTGGVLSERITAKGRRVRVFEQAGQAGGACATHYVAGVAIDAGGPHFYHTTDEYRWDYVKHGWAFNRYELRRAVRMSDGSILSFPPNSDVCARLTGGEPPADLCGFERATVDVVGWGAYRSLYRRYTRAQWALPPAQLDARLAGRTSRSQEDDRSFPGECQGVPLGGWTRIIDLMFARCEERTFGERIDDVAIDRLVREGAIVLYTGCLEDLFPDDPRRLPYRGQRQTTSFETWPWPVAVVNEAAPGKTGLLRTFCWTWIRSGNKPKRTEPVVVGRTYPAPTPKLYPVPVAGAEETYLGLLDRCLIRWRGRVVPCGRLGLYKYLDMDDAVRIALSLAEVVATNSWPADRTAQRALILKLRGAP